MKTYFENIKELIDTWESDCKDPKTKSYIKKLKLIFNGLQQTSFKINSAAKLIDYFVHDILDYTILKTHSESFTRELKQFDIRESIKEIDEVLQDKY